MSCPFDINREFESELCRYTGAKFAVTTNSCTMALFLALKWHYEQGCGFETVAIPARTYVSVPMVIKQAGFNVAFEDREWRGWYNLRPLQIWDSARYFTSGIFNQLAFDLCSRSGFGFVCVSFHSTKTLGLKRQILREAGLGDLDSDGLYPTGEWDIEQGGAILHNSPEADAWFRKARFDGRTEGVAPAEDRFDMIGYHCYLNPSSARLGLQLLRQLPQHNPPLPNDDYPDLSLHPIFGGKGAE